MSLIEGLIKSAKLAKQGAKVAVESKPFFSAVDKAALDLQRAKGTGKEFMTELKKTKGVKPAEIQDRGLQKIESMPKMTKDEFLSHLEENPPTDLKETAYSEDPEMQVHSDVFLKTVGHLPKDQQTRAWFDIPEPERKRLLSKAESKKSYLEGTKYEKYAIPGGTNYREILLKLPSRYPSIAKMSRSEYDQAVREVEKSGVKNYHSSHWEDDPNVLAHMRVSDREGPNGELILHVEEIQSDWHQAGRSKGYASGKEQAQIDELLNKKEELKALRNELHTKASELPDGREDEFIAMMDKANNITPQLMSLQSEIDKLSDLKRTGVPDAPFKKNWHELAMKRLINYASEHGYDGIAITPGAEQANRYDLSKQISKIDYNKYNSGQNELKAWDKDGKKVLEKYGASQEEVADYIGKEAAEKLFAATPKDNHMGGQRYSLIGEDLRVGGEGMKGFYDKMIPDYLNTFGKKYGVQTEMGGYKLLGDPSLRGEASERLGLAGQRFDQMTPEEIEAFNNKLDESNAVNLHYFPITSEMREDVKQGMPLYQQIGVPIGTGAAGAEMGASQEEEPAYASGGAVYNTNPDMSDGGQIIQGDAFKRGGKVHIAKNLDTMLMELQDKKFKRK